MNDVIESARYGHQRVGRGCIVSLPSEEPRYATVSELAVRFDAEADSTMLLTAISEAVGRYNPESEAAILLEVASGYQVLIISTEGYEYVGGLTFEGYGLLGPVRA